MSNEGIKNDQGKIRMELLSPKALRGTAKVLTFGANKYSARNWEKGINFSRVKGALDRHLSDWWDRIDTDDETGLNHLHHAACCIMFLQHYVECGAYKMFDDRPEIYRGDQNDE